MDVTTFSRAMTHPIRRRILEQLPDEGGGSPSDLAQHLGVSTGAISYHFRKLAALRLIKLKKRVPRRGAVEHYYVRASGVKGALESLDKLAKSLEKVGKR